MANSVVNQIKVGSTTYDMKPYLSSATSGDNTTATSWTNVSTAIANTDSYDTVFNKITTMVRNVRYLYNKLGTTDFSGISSTVSGALTTLNSGKSDTTHNHDTAYAAKSHTHSEYSLTTHTHSNYSTTGHTHSEYASSTHNHDTAYAAKSHSHSGYSTTGHTHSNYSTTGHTHSNYSTTGHTHSYIATSNIVTSQTNSTTKVPAASLCYAMDQAYQTDLTNVTNGKSSIATAITNKGGSASGTDTFAQLATAINNIPTGHNVGISTYNCRYEGYSESISFTTTFKATNFICMCYRTGSGYDGFYNPNFEISASFAYIDGAKYNMYMIPSIYSINVGRINFYTGNYFTPTITNNSISISYRYILEYSTMKYICVYWD